MNMKRTEEAKIKYLETTPLILFEEIENLLRKVYEKKQYS